MVARRQGHGYHAALLRCHCSGTLRGTTFNTLTLLSVPSPQKAKAGQGSCTHAVLPPPMHGLLAHHQSPTTVLPRDFPCPTAPANTINHENAAPQPHA